MKYNYIGTNEKMTYFQSSWKSGQSRSKITKVVGHDFAGGETLTAKAGAKLIVDRMKANGNSANVHWIVDANDCYAVIPESQSAYATGVMSYNQSTLNIEIAPSFTKGTEKSFSSEANKQNYYKAWQNMCKLIADICVKYSLTTKDIMQHNQIKSTACPYTMKVYFGSYDKALSETKKQVQKEIDALKGVNKEIEYIFYTKVNATANGLYKYNMKVVNNGAVIYKDANCTKSTGRKISDWSTKMINSRFVKTITKNGSKWWIHEFIDTNGDKRYYCYKKTK